MEFRLLGPVEVFEDGEPLSLGGPKQRGLLVLLLLHANDPVSRDALIDGLWGSRPPRSAGHMVDDYVSRLRKLVGAERIVRKAPGYQLLVEPGELDLDRFEDVARRGRAALAAGRHADASALLTEALALWRGTALADIVFEPSASVESTRLEELRTGVLEDRFEADLARGAGEELVPELEAAVREQPLRERLVGELMLAHYRSGRQTAALEVYRILRHHLADDLGLEPSPQLRELERRILEHDPTLAPARPTAIPWPRSRRHLVAGSAVLLAALAVAGSLALWLRGGGSSVSAQPAQNEILQLSPAGRIERTSAVTDAPTAAAPGPSSLWVSDASGHQLLRTNQTSGVVVDRVPLPSAPGNVVVGGGSVWVADSDDASLRRIDLATDGLTERTPLPSIPGGLAYGGGSVWVGDPADRTLLRVDPATGQITHTLEIGIPPSAIAFGAGMLWVASFADDTVIEVDPASGSTTATLNVGGGPTAILYVDGFVWVANELDGTVARVDPKTSAVTNTIPTGSSPSALTATPGAVWVSNEDSDTVTRIDTGTARVTETVAVGGDPTTVAAAHGAVWVGTRASVSHHGGTLVLADTRRFFSIDPQVDEEAPNAQFLGMVNDSLVTWDHVSGPEGLHLVPDLALRVPIPSNDGRTYLFTLRPRLVYSTGLPVRASDFKRSMTRLFRVGSPSAPYFRDVIGVTAGDHDRTVTFRLSTADPDFLLKLAVGAVVPIPPGTPMRDVGSHPIPGTGPYKWAEVGSKELRFVRNPRFHEWSHAAQPDGNPDEIVWRFGKSPRQEVQEAIAGKADWTSDTPEDLAAVAQRYPALVHVDPTPTASLFQLNTHVAPFNDVRVRRAVNYAVDRHTAVRLLGGPMLNTPLCQTIAPGLAGHRPYCPYTADPSRNGTWHAPDLRKARALIAESGTRGDRITVTDVSDTGAPEPIAVYMTKLLDKLGYRSRVHVLTSAQMNSKPDSFRQGLQLQPFVWGPDFPSAAGVLGPLIACDGAFNPGYFCDPALDREMNEAEAIRETNPDRSQALWARIDRQVTDDAVWVPLVNQGVTDVVSARVRNYEFSPAYLFLTDQAWLR